MIRYFYCLALSAIVAWLFVVIFLYLNIVKPDSFIAPKAIPIDKTVIPVESRSKPIEDAWIESTHRVTPGDTWKSIEAESIRQLIANRSRSSSSITVTGEWQQRGPSNIPGRITDIAIDYMHSHIYTISDHGIIFKSSDLNATNWEALNDQYPLGLGVASQLLVFPGEGTEIVSSGYLKVTNGWGIRYSDDDGEGWVESDGIGDYPIMGIRRMMRDDVSVYVFIHEYNPAVPTDYYSVYKSSSHGESFSLLYRSNIPVGDGGRHIKSDMWVSNDPADQYLYLSLEDSLFQVNKVNGARTFKGRVSNQVPNQALLTGLVMNGVAELSAYEAFEGIGKFYAWNSITQTWLFKGQMSDWWLSLPFGGNSFSCSQLSPDTLYFGAILTSRSTDRGLTWTTIDMDPTGSYALYHGDVPKTMNVINPNTLFEETYMGTDGGLYKLDPEADHFNSMSIPGLNCTQIYKMVSTQSEPWKMGIGTQDNGYCYTLDGTTQVGIVDHTFLWGGDVTNVASGDGGATFWLWWLGDGCNYMAGMEGDDLVSTWSPYPMNGSIPYWEAPIWVSNHHPNRCYTAGFLNNGSGSHLIELKAVQGQTANAHQYAFDFLQAVGGKITAIAVSPIDSSTFYAGTENGYLLTSINDGVSWTSELLSPFMYVRAIHPSTLTYGKLWVGGSGYSNSPVFHSTNNGDTFSSLNSGLPSCIVEAFAANDTETSLFIATSIGPFMLDVDEGPWMDMAGTQAPLVHYMDVEYLTDMHVVRYATYARGVWDYRIDCNEFASTTNIWIGPSGGSWNGSTTFWSLGHRPLRCEDVIIPSTAIVNLISEPAVEIRSLTIQTGGKLHILPGIEILVQE